MPVRSDQIDELLDVFLRKMPEPRVIHARDLLIELRDTRAYGANKSFAVTIDRLLARLQQH